MKQIFISDLHLEEDREDLTRAYFLFLEKHCQDADEIYILGDFFEVWLGDDNHSTFNETIINALAALKAQVFVMHGNRDFLIGNDFCSRASATLLPELTVIKTTAGNALLLHGDSLCTLDTEYMNARVQLRSEAFQIDFLSKSLEERDAFARNLRGESKEHAKETAADIMDVTPEEVVLAMNQAEVGLMIHGHTHRPAIHEIELDPNASTRTGTRYVLGDWHDSMQYLEIEDGYVALKLYNFV